MATISTTSGLYNICNDTWTSNSTTDSLALEQARRMAMRAAEFERQRALENQIRGMGFGQVVTEAPKKSIVGPTKTFRAELQAEVDKWLPNLAA